MKTAFFALTLFACLAIAHAQDSAFYFCGKVLMQSNNRPVNKACVTLKGSLRSVYTNSKGEFCIKVNKKRAVLEVEAPYFKKAYLSVPFLVKPETAVMLKEEFDSTQTKQTEAAFILFQQKDHEVLDYLPQQDRLFVLTENTVTNRCFLFYLANDGKILSYQRLSGNCIRFHKDYTGTIMLLKESSSVEIHTNPVAGNFSLTNEKDILKYEKESFPFIFSDAQNNYLSIVSAPDYILNTQLDLKMRARALSYFSISKDKKTRSLFKNLSDDRSQKLPSGEKTHLDLNMQRLPFSNGNANYSEIYAPIFKTANGACLFDFGNNRIENYDSTGKLTNSEPVFFHKNENWTGKIFQDEASNKFYYLYYFEKNKNTNAASWSINEIIPSTGAKVPVKKLDGRAMALIRIHNQELFFMTGSDRSTIFREMLNR